MVHMTKEGMESWMVEIPSLTEQRRIAEILDKIDALRVKRRAAIAELDTLTRSIFLDMFGDPATNQKGWPTVALGALASDVRGGASLELNDFLDSGFPDTAQRGDQGCQGISLDRKRRHLRAGVRSSRIRKMSSVGSLWRSHCETWFRPGLASGSWSTS